MKLTEADSSFNYYWIILILMFLFANFRLFHVLVEVLVEKHNQPL